MCWGVGLAPAMLEDHPTRGTRKASKSEIYSSHRLGFASLRSGTASPASWQERCDDCHRENGTGQLTDRLEHTGQSELSHRRLFGSKRERASGAGGAYRPAPRSPPPSAQGAARPPRPGPDHRRLRRRSERHRHLFPGRRAVRLRHVLGDAVQLPADGGDPGDQRPHRPRDRPGHRRQHPRALPALAAARDRRAAAGRQHRSISAPISARWARR